jgi:metal-sulfur cluster biosynthetic enzyme
MIIPSEILEAVSSVREVESNISITEMKLVESLEFKDGTVTLKYHCVSPFCPAMLVLATGLELKSKLLNLECVEEARISVVNHYLAEKINSKIATSFVPRRNSKDSTAH